MTKLTVEKVKALRKEFGDSFYILDSDVFEENYKSLIKAFEVYYPNFNIAYSYKTNYIPKLVRIVDRMGGFAEVVSDMEAEIALKSGVDPKKIIWNGPVKNKTKLSELLFMGVTVNIDSIAEYESIKLLADSNSDMTINVGVRCNYDVGDGVLSRFGIDVSSPDFNRILEDISLRSNVTFVGFQAHFAKRDPKYWVKRAEGMVDICQKAKEQHGLTPQRIDIGGGIFGRMPEELRNQLGVAQSSFDDYAKNAASIIEDYYKNEVEKPVLLAEPGTALAADCMRYICSIETIKDVRGKKIATTNGSQKNISLSGINPPMDVLKIGDNRDYYDDLDIAGYTCIESDYLFKGFKGDLAVGDSLVFSNCGSYSVVMKPPFIFTNVPVIDVSGLETEIIKRSETFEDLFLTYAFD